MLTETTAELAAALTLAAARRVAEADVYMRGGQYKGWLPTLFVGQLLQVGVCLGGIIGYFSVTMPILVSAGCCRVARR